MKLEKSATKSFRLLTDVYGENDHVFLSSTYDFARKPFNYNMTKVCANRCLKTIQIICWAVSGQKSNVIITTPLLPFNRQISLRASFDYF